MTFSTKNTKKQQKQQQQTRKPAKKAKRKRKPRAKTSAPRFARMLNDPCSASVEPGIFGTVEGYTAKFNSSYLAGTAGSTAGYILWSPNYTPKAPVLGGVVNMVGALTATSATTYVNTVAAPSYTGALFGATGVFSAADPASGFVSGTTCDDARTLAACMSMMYTGKLLDVQGEIAFIENYPNQGMGESATPSVDQLFSNASRVERLGTGKYEVKFRLDENSHVFADEDTGPIHIGNPGSTSTTLPTYTRAITPSWIGFAWRGFDITSAPALRFSFSKALEWRPTDASGLTQVEPINLGGSSLAATQGWLDRNIPEWWNRSVDTATAVGSRLAGLALSGYVARQRSIRN